MGVGLKYDSTKFLITLAVAVAVYFLLLPSLWPQPSGKVDLPPRITYGRDLPVTVKATCWHPNYSVRRVRLSINNVNSPALTDNRPLLPWRGKLRHGALRGTVDIDIDYTEVSSTADYPALSVLVQVPWEVEVTR